MFRRKVVGGTSLGLARPSDRSLLAHRRRHRLARQAGAVFMRSTKPKDFRSIPSASIDAHATSRPTLCTARHQNARTRVDHRPIAFAISAPPLAL